MNAPQEEWTDWFEHDGKGCPCVGQMVEMEASPEWEGRFKAHRARIVGPTTVECIARDTGCWHWEIVGGNIVQTPTYVPCIRFRIRRPKGMAILNAILADLPAPVKTDGVIA